MPVGKRFQTFHSQKSSTSKRWLHLAWTGFFGIWLLLLSGWISGQEVAPGVVQLTELKSLLQQKKQKLQNLEEKQKQLKARKKALKTNPSVIEREIRTVLGYASSDELVFKFTRR